MSSDLLITLALLVAAIVLFIINKPRMDAVALMVVIALPLLGIVSLPEALAGFSDPNVILIELLVVVVILAILAAIAIPNLLEAQTRAKVARVTSDLRAAATCMEAYAVDNNAYPEPLLKLSTPVAYASNAYAPDAFANPGGWFALGYVQAQTGSQRQFLTDFNVQNPADTQRAIMATHRYFVFSNGPDLLDEALENPTESFHDVVRAPNATLGYFYDPSNGTVSRGDIMRSGRHEPFT